MPRLSSNSTGRFLPFISSIIAASFLLAAAGPASSAVEYQKAASSRPNIQGGYDFYDKSGKKTGYSVPNRRGGYDYYNLSGNKTGGIAKKDKSGGDYIYYDAIGIKKGYLTKDPTGVYTYKDVQGGTIAKSVTQTSSTDIGSLSPNAFREKKN